MVKRFHMTSPYTKMMVFQAAVVCWLLGTSAACAPKPAAQALSAPPVETFFVQESTRQFIDPQQVHYDLLAAALFHETNRVRRKNGRPPLDHDARLDAAARMHAGDMARYHFLSHTNLHRPERRTPRERALLAGFQFRFLAENIATQFAIQYHSGRTVYPVPAGTGFSYSPAGPPIPRHTYRTFAQTVLDQWMNSPGHRENILSYEPERFGSDCRLGKEKNGPDKFYCVQLFGAAKEKN